MSEVIVPRSLHEKATRLVALGIFKSVDEVAETAVGEFLRKHWDPNFTTQP